MVAHLACDVDREGEHQELGYAPLITVLIKDIILMLVLQLAHKPVPSMRYVLTTFQ